MSDTTPDMLAAALALHAAGCSVVAVRTDGSKRPQGDWKQAQAERASEDAVRAWFAGGHPGLGVVCGQVSGGLEMLELEGRAVDEGVLTKLVEILANSGMTELWTRIATGWLERSPSGGLHMHYLVASGAPGNTKLASRLAREDELTEQERDLLVRHPNKRILRGLIETRGEGGFVVTAPSHGTVHATGRPYELLAGGPATLPTITAEEHRALHTVCRMLDTVPADETLDHFRDAAKVIGEPLDEAAAFLFSGSGTPAAEGGLTPGDDFEARASWPDILLPHGWRPMFKSGATSYWQRPGKDGREPSATTGRALDRDRLYVFTTSTEFVAERPYTKFGAYALLNHSGDHSAAASSLRRQGYGAPAPEPVRHLTSVPAPRPAIDGTAALNVVQHPSAVAEAGPETYTRTDDGNALRLIDEHEQEIRYVPQRGRWLRWDGHRWAWDEAGTVREMARAIARDLPNGEGEAKHRMRSLSTAGIAAMVTMAQTDPRVVVHAGQLDAHRMLLNTPAGAVDLTTGELSAPDPDEMHTRSTKIAPDAAVPTPKWDRFLDQTFGDDAELKGYVQRMAGYAASGSVRWHILPFLHGPGGNGKGVFLNVLRAVLGDYAATAPNAFLMAGAQRHETEIARLHGLRLVIASEVNQEAKFDEAKVKELTGGDGLTARFMRQDHFTFEPTHKLFLMGNHQPRVSAGGKSFWRRLRLMPFTRTPEEVIEDLDLLLISEEAPGILAWIVAGAVAVFRDGLQDPASVTAATAQYAAEEDALARFLDEACHVGGGVQVRTLTDVFRTAYEKWCRGEGEDPLPSRQLGRELKDRFQITRKPSNGTYSYINVALQAPADDRWDDK
ncbi:bifunctional DNA primase/polymerase [Streptomyces sp. ISL-43]|uniref:phage/plasmid primase, P4 family n=1 Tax=Streptomyces sp. ISL-43 TaxID=2819183 RepID=UPI001BEC4628|nr:phage/plasmid primase, P4 family [Streptomyces sp. ISL-43]MBT2449447.1 bifunctional DNA primase/polymerase [Streptomyces sp. ISL-43]